MSQYTLREGLTPPPPRMQSLPIDSRGYPVPWFVQWVVREECQLCRGMRDSMSASSCPACEGVGEILLPVPVGTPGSVPEFRAMDPNKRALAIKKKLCWVCGGRLGVNVTFVAGPMCGVNRTSAEPPNHYECALWSALNCPFLSNPRMVRREDEHLNNAQLVDSAPGIAITRNPQVTMLWVTRHFECFDDGRGSYLIQMGEPERVEWYAEAKPASHKQVMDSVRSGLPSLYAIADKQEGSMKLLSEMLTSFLEYVPAK